MGGKTCCNAGVGPRILAVIAAGLSTLLAVGSASGADGASLRAFSLVPAERYTLLVDGTARIAAGTVRAGPVTPLRPGRHVLAAREGRRIVARIVVRVAARDDLVELLSTTRRGGRLLLVLNAGPVDDAAVRFRVANLDPYAGPVSVLAGKAGLRVVSSLPFGVVSAVRSIPGAADPSGVLDLAVSDRAGQTISTGRLVLAAGTVSLFVLAPGPEGSLLVRVPALRPAPEPLTPPLRRATEPELPLVHRWYRPIPVGTE